MPPYELLCIMKAFERPELVQAIKRGAEAIIQKGGIIRSFENLGFNELPYTIKRRNQVHKTGNYILIKFDLPSKETKAIEKEFVSNVDVIRSTIAPLKEEYTKEYQCKCLDNGKFMKDHIDYMRPLTVWNRRKVYRDYSIRL